MQNRDKGAENVICQDVAKTLNTFTVSKMLL